MAYDEQLTERFRKAAQGLGDLSEKRMMGGVCFLLNGNMLGGADRNKEGLKRFMFRVGKGAHLEALKRPGAIPMEMGGRRMGGFIFVDAETCDDRMLSDWIALANSFVSELPAK